jgi:hypothetical protein
MVQYKQTDSRFSVASKCYAEKPLILLHVIRIVAKFVGDGSILCILLVFVNSGQHASGQGSAGSAARSRARFVALGSLKGGDTSSGCLKSVV